MYQDNNYLEHYGVPGMRWGFLNPRKTMSNRKAIRQARKDANHYNSLEANRKFASPKAVRKLSEEIYAKAKSNAVYAKEFGRSLTNERAQTKRLKTLPKNFRRSKKMLLRDIERTKRLVNGKNAVTQMGHYMGKGMSYIKDNSITYKGWEMLTKG